MGTELVDEQTKHDAVTVGLPMLAAFIAWIVRGLIHQRSVAVHDFRITVSGLHDKINTLRSEHDQLVAVLKDREVRR